MILNKKSILAAALFSTLCFLGSQNATADSSLFDINTAALTTAVSGPFSLDLTLISGGTFSNTVSISNFSFTGGSATGTATATGSATGNLFSSVTLKSGTNAFNDLYQSFSSGTTDIKFKVTTTSVVGGTPDGFSVSILDGAINPILTTDLTNSTLADITLRGNTPGNQSQISTFQSTSPAGVTASLLPSPVPETATGWPFIAGMVALSAFLRRRMLWPTKLK